MGTEENKKLVLQHYDSFVNKQDAEAVRSQLSPEFRDHEMPPDTPAGPEAVVKYGAMLHAAFPDLAVQVDDIIAEGDLVAVRASWTGTHKGHFPLMPVPVSNRQFAFKGMVFWRVRDGRIVERWATIDRMGLQQQLAPRP